MFYYKIYVNAGACGEPFEVGVQSPKPLKSEKAIVNKGIKEDLIDHYQSEFVHFTKKISEEEYKKVMEEYENLF